MIVELPNRQLAWILSPVEGEDAVGENDHITVRLSPNQGGERRVTPYRLADNR